MPRNWRIAALAAFALAVAACSTDQSQGGGSTAGLDLNILVGNTDVGRVKAIVDCDDPNFPGPLEVYLNALDGRDPPIWSSFMDLAGICTIQLVAEDDDGDAICTSDEETVEIPAFDVTKVDLVLVCNVNEEEALGMLDVDGTFDIIADNFCQRFVFLEAVPQNIPENGTADVQIVTTDTDGDDINVQCTAGTGAISDESFNVPPASGFPTVLTYTCQAPGPDTITCVTNDGNKLCDKTKTFDVLCGGNDLCEGIDCSDGNPCTADNCNSLTGACSNPNLPNGTTCEEGQITGVCVAGVCEVDLCDGVVCPPASSECSVNECNPANGLCEETALPDGAICGDLASGTDGQCQGGVCAQGPCQLCREDSCRDFNGADVVAGCFDPTVLVGNAEAGPAAGTSKVDLCIDYVNCGFAQPDVCGGVAADTCYCGASNPFECISSPGPQGVCVPETEAAAESTVPNEVATRASNPFFAYGGGSNLFRCLRERCANECF